MKRTNRVAAVVWGSILLALALCLPFPPQVQAQTAGNNAVCSSSGTGCSNLSSQTTGSGAFIDATAVGGSGDICARIYSILLPPGFVSGAVIDARGIGSNLTCASGTSPWYNSSNGYQNKASTILLPAQTIVIKYPWILPSGTKVIGEGTGSTIIQRCNGISCFGSGDWMIEFGSSSATGISVEDLTVDGINETSPGGILNQYAQDSSYVDHVDLYRILGTGLEITGSAQNSGPYSNITYNTNGVASSSAVCVDLYNVSGGTRGIHGLTCLGDTNDRSPVAVYLDSSNNSLEDVRIAGFSEGILVGSQASAQSNVLVNILGDTNNNALQTPVYVILISANTVTNVISDLSVMGVTNLGAGGTIYSIYDETTSTYLQDSNVAMYALGKSTADGYSRFTTSPNAATWVVGGSTPIGSCAPGSLYSDTSSGALYVCVYATSGSSWGSAVPTH
jgi:hypothetical protein